VGPRRPNPIASRERRPRPADSFNLFYPPCCARPIQHSSLEGSPLACRSQIDIAPVYRTPSPEHSVVEGGDGKPTAQSYAVFKDLSGRLDVQLAKLDTIVKTDALALNKEMRRRRSTA
jgi:hypothetical protein